MIGKKKDDKQDKNRGSVVESIREYASRATAASMSRQQGRSNMTSNDLSPKAKGGAATVKEAPNGKEYMGPGYGEYKPKQQAGQEQVKYKKPERRRPTGREEMIAQRYMDNEDKKKKGGSSVVGS
jgi:hypothetical protein